LLLVVVVVEVVIQVAVVQAVCAQQLPQVVVHLELLNQN
jgi:hypothetical protein